MLNLLVMKYYTRPRNWIDSFKQPRQLEDHREIRWGAMGWLHLA